MQKKVIKYTIFIIILLSLGYNSIYFRKLDAVKAAAASQKFDAAAYARSFYEQLNSQLDSAVETGKLITLLKTEPAKAFNEHSNALSIGNVRCFLVHGEGTVTAINDDVIGISLADSTIKGAVTIATEFIYGNAIRDASGLVELKDFTNTADLNGMSEEVNKIIRKDVIPPFKRQVKKGDVILFSGAIEMNKAHVSVDSIEIIPIRLSIVNN
jgi:predicted lipoprotein